MDTLGIINGIIDEGTFGSPLFQSHLTRLAQISKPLTTRSLL